jgi:DNA-binding transcriptional MerR regulator
METFKGRKAAALSGFKTVAMLDYLQRSGVFEPTGQRGLRGRGRCRTYTFRDVLVLKALKRLLDSGVSVAALRDPLQRFQRRSWLANPSTIEDKDGPLRYLIASNEQVDVVRNPDKIVELSRQGKLTFSMIIDLENLHIELREAMGMKVVKQEALF